METDSSDFLAITADYVQSDEADMVILERAVLPNFALTSDAGYDIRRDWGFWPVCFQSVPKSCVCAKSYPRLRKEQKLGPYGAFMRLSHEWRGKLGRVFYVSYIWHWLTFV
jgi:hypothetical protein